jgi:hypothetical protein
MDWQDFVAFFMVAMTASWFLVRKKLRAPRPVLNRLRDCGCGFPSPDSTGSSIRFHAKKGEPRQIMLIYK